MPWLKETCQEGICGIGLGIAKGVFGVSLFTSDEVTDINNCKKLALSVFEKSPEIVTDPAICEAIRQGKKSGLDAFVAKTSAEAFAVAAAETVCTQAFKKRFADVLMGACLNLVGC